MSSHMTICAKDSVGHFEYVVHEIRYFRNENLA